MAPRNTTANGVDRRSGAPPRPRITKHNGILGFAAFGQRDCPFVVALQQQLSFSEKRLKCPLTPTMFSESLSLNKNTKHIPAGLHEGSNSAVWAKRD
jgi:hypothetical protein